MILIPGLLDDDSGVLHSPGGWKLEYVASLHVYNYNYMQAYAFPRTSGARNPIVIVKTFFFFFSPPAKSGAAG